MSSLPTRISGLLFAAIWATSFILFGLSSWDVANGQVEEEQKRVDVPLVDETVVFEEIDGLLAVEAEHCFQQTSVSPRRFYLTTKQSQPEVSPDGDPNHVGGASNGAYLEILPDTRRTHGDKLTHGQNFSPQPGKQAIVSYKVKINNPGRYYVWARAYSTGSEDNGLHVGINGTWPASGQRLQWCAGKHSWRWESRQRTKEEHCGVRHGIFLDIAKPGVHTIHFSMREDGFEFDKWLMTTDRNFKRPDDVGPPSRVASNAKVPQFEFVKAPPKPVEPIADPAHKTPTAKPSPTKSVSELPLVLPRGNNGDGSISFGGELKTWHKVTLSMQGPYAHEHDNQPNPFTDYGVWVTFTHQGGTTYHVPGYFAADGNASESSAQSGTVWKAHFAPDLPGEWRYTITFRKGKNSAFEFAPESLSRVETLDGKTGLFLVTESDKTGRDLRSHGRLQYVGKRYPRFTKTQKYFLKIGADAPETLLAYRDFDGTKANKKNIKLKSYAVHRNQHFQPGDPTWQNGKGKGLIGAIRYLSNKGCNAFSFLTYNAGGDGDNVWPFVHRDDKLHYDCSKLDQWGIVFDYATTRGMYLHFKLQETENDDHTKGAKGKLNFVPESLDGGELGVQRKLYLREMIARFGHQLALNWNLGEENTQSKRQQIQMINFIKKMDAYQHLIVVHTFPQQQEQVYQKLLGNKSNLTGVSLQNSHINATHRDTLKWVKTSEKSGKPWVIAFDESGSAAHGVCPDLGYRGFDGKDAEGKYIYTEHEVRSCTLWGALMAGGVGCEYYFGYKFDENDLHCEDWTSRDRSWDYGRIAINFFHDHKIPFWDMNNHNSLVGNLKDGNDRYCFAKPGEVYVIYAAKSQTSFPEIQLDLTEVAGQYSVHWFNPRSGGKLLNGNQTSVSGGQQVSLGQPPEAPLEDWVILVRKK